MTLNYHEIRTFPQLTATRPRFQISAPQLGGVRKAKCNEFARIKNGLAFSVGIPDNIFVDMSGGLLKGLGAVRIGGNK